MSTTAPLPSSRKLEKRWQSVVENSPYFIAIADPTGTILYANRTVKGLEMKDVIGKHFHDLEEPGYHHLSNQAMEQSFQKGKSGNYQVKGVGSHGTTSWYEVYYAPIRQNGQVQAITFSTVDITERKQAEKALSETLDELENTVEERTMELAIANKDLEKKTYNLEETNTALRVLLKNRDQDKREFEEKIVSNVNEMVFPYVEKLSHILSEDKEKVYLDLIKTHLEDITAPFIHQMSSKYSELTPTEIKIAGLVKDGKSSKSIAEILGINVGTVSIHRKSLRKKLGIRNKKINLRSHLLLHT